MAKFVHYKSIKIPYSKQGLIYFTCVNYNNIPESEQRLIRNLCEKVAGDDSAALLEFLTDGNRSASSASLKYFISEKKLYILRRRFYEMWHSVHEARASREKMGKIGS